MRDLTPQERFDMGLAILASEEMRGSVPEDGWPVAVIAEACQCSEGKVFHLLKQALRKLAKAIRIEEFVSRRDVAEWAHSSELTNALAREQDEEAEAA